MKTINEVKFDLDMDSPCFYFGEPWPAGLFDGPTEQIQTPIGYKCWYCTEEVKEDDQGTFIITAALPDHPPVSPQHRECSLRSVLGGVNCLLGKCDEPDHSPDPVGVSKREGALLAWEHLQTHGWSEVERARYGDNRR